jgi:hypothetical protein
MGAMSDVASGGPAVSDEVPALPRSILTPGGDLRLLLDTILLLRERLDALSCRRQLFLNLDPPML